MQNILKLLLIIISLKNIFVSKLKKTKIAHYFIISRDETIIDKRTLYFFKKNKFNNSLNLIRTSDLNYKTFLKIIKIQNLFCYSIFKNLISKKLGNKYFLKFLEMIFKFINIRYLYLIDDRREVNFFSKLSRINKLKVLIYMHGKFSRKSKNLSNLSFNKYLVWSNFFKKQLLQINKNYKSENIIVVGNPLFKEKFLNKTNAKFFKIKRCLILDEDYISFYKMKNFFETISKHTNIKFYLKKKVTRELPKEFERFCFNNNLRIINSKQTLGDIVKKYKINSILASTSTGLLEASYYNTVPINFNSMEYNRENEFDVFVKERLVYKVKNKINFINLIHKKYTANEINMKKKKLWGHSQFKYKNVRKIIEGFTKI